MLWSNSEPVVRTSGHAYPAVWGRCSGAVDCGAEFTVLALWVRVLLIGVAKHFFTAQFQTLPSLFFVLFFFFFKILWFKCCFECIIYKKNSYSFCLFSSLTILWLPIFLGLHSPDSVYEVMLKEKQYALVSRFSMDTCWVGQVRVKSGVVLHTVGPWTTLPTWQKFLAVSTLYES